METILRRISNKIFPLKKAEINVLDLNTRYDLETIEIIKGLDAATNCIDIGAHKGDILKYIIKYAPQGAHFAFEPLPDLYNDLQKKYGKLCKVYPYALSDTEGNATFNYVTTNPAYSGLKKRRYDRPEEDSTINVEVRKLDTLIPDNLPIGFLKIDVEGAEFGVLKGALSLLSRWKPVIVYEQGLGGSDIYGTSPEAFFDFMSALGYQISLMEYYLSKKQPLTRDEYCHHFKKGYNYYFIAYNL
jgi:FkbM family methyltransferase